MGILKLGLGHRVLAATPRREYITLVIGLPDHDSLIEV